MAKDHAHPLKSIPNALQQPLSLDRSLERPPIAQGETHFEEFHCNLVSLLAFASLFDSIWTLIDLPSTKGVPPGSFILL
jgi:hypothetical protein